MKEKGDAKKKAAAENGASQLEVPAGGNKQSTVFALTNNINQALNAKRNSAQKRKNLADNSNSSETENSDSDDD